MAVYSLDNIALATDPEGITVSFDVIKDGVYEKTHSGMIGKFRTVNDIVEAIRKMALASIQDDVYRSVVFPKVIAWFVGREWDIG